MLVDILSLPCSGDIKEKFGCLQAKQLGHHPACQHMRQRGGPHESTLCHTKGLAPSSQAAGVHHKNTIVTLEMGSYAWATLAPASLRLFGLDVQ